MTDQALKSQSATIAELNQTPLSQHVLSLLQKAVDINGCVTAQQHLTSRP